MHEDAYLRYLNRPTWESRLVIRNDVDHLRRPATGAVDALGIVSDRQRGWRRAVLSHSQDTEISA